MLWSLLLVSGLCFGLVQVPGADSKRGSTPSAKPDSAKVTEQTMQFLHANCLSCHNAEKHKGGLELTSRTAALKGGDNGPALVPGKPEESAMLKALRSDADPHMPPKKQLSTNQIQLVRRWIAAGASWNDTALARAAAPRNVTLGALPANYHPVFAIAVSPNGKQLAIGRGNRIFLHDLTSTNFSLLVEQQAHREVVRALAWHPDGSRLASSSFREIKLWNATTLQPIWSISSNLVDRIPALQFTAAGDLLVATDGANSQSGWVRLFAPDTGKEVGAWQAHADTIFDVAISPDGRLLATAGGDRLVKIWDLKTRKEITQLEGHVEAVLGLAFNTNASELVTVSADKHLKVWDVKTREIVVRPKPKKHGFNAVAWSADGKTVAAAGDDGTLLSYTEFKRHTGEQSSSTGKENQLGRWAEPLQAVAISPDGKRIFAGGQDGIVYVVNKEGKMLAKLEQNTGTEPTQVSQLEPGADSKAMAKRTKISRSKKEERSEKNISPSFVRDVLPVMAKAGCMSGSCHAKAEGQNGFKLSVFSYDPKTDYAEIVKEGEGRRVFPAAPNESLLLLKPTMAIEHGGGQRFEVGSEPYQLLAEWIRGGMVYQHTNEPALVRISVEPKERTFRKGAKQPLRVQALYADGSKRDVTQLAEFAANEKEMAQVSEEGLLQIGALSGESAVVARYMGFVDAARITVPADRTLPSKRYASLRANNFIDELANAQFRKLGLLPSDLCTDAEFLRRSSLDTIGQLPTSEETREFLADPDPQKRLKWIDQLLVHHGWGDYWANKWADLLRPNPDRVGVKSVFVLDQWLRESFRNNKPYDQLVREILLAEGSNHRDGPAVVYRDRREPPELTTMFSQLFLGIRMECAKCHHHPNEKWSQDDFYEFAAFFGTVKQKGAGLSPPISAGAETFYFSPGGTVKHPVSEAVMKPRPPDGQMANVAANVDPRGMLADWMTHPTNSFFAKATVNRIWASYFGRGFVNPVDDFRASNPASQEAVLHALAHDFARHGYDLKHLMRTIMSSRLYQLSSTPNAYNLSDTKNFSRSYRRRLPAEVLLDAVNQVTGVADDFNGSPPGTRALQTWSYKVNSQFMDAFGRPNPSSDCPCDRDARTSVVQSLHMMNSRALQSKLSNPEGRLNKLAASKLVKDEIVTELYLAAFNRFPTAEELKTATAAYDLSETTRQTATEDVLWALLNSAEFVFNH